MDRQSPAGGSGTTADDLVRALDPIMSLLGLLFLLVVLGQNLARDSGLQALLAAAGWLLWAAFAAEFGLRVYATGDRARFLRRHWWQVLFLLLPFLRFLRLFRLLRLARAGPVVSSAIRGGRSAGRLLSSRLGWLSSVSAVVVLAASQLLYTVGPYPTYGEALHDAALATITGEPLSRSGSAFADVLEILLAAYSVAVFATVAAAVGAYFLRPDQPSRSVRRHHDTQ